MLFLWRELVARLSKLPRLLGKMGDRLRLEPISIGLERERGGGVVDIFPEMEMIDGAALFGRSA
jgi:hypothetical protein